MPCVISGSCRQCDYEVDLFVDQSSSLFACGTCGVAQVIHFQYRRFEISPCGECGKAFGRADLVGYSENRCTKCPACGSPSLGWREKMDVLLGAFDEQPPQIGDVVHGTMINTGHLQRLEIVHSIYRGRISSEQRTYAHGVYVEAEVVSVGPRSVDVKLLGETFNSFGELGGETAVLPK